MLLATSPRRQAIRSTRKKERSPFFFFSCLLCVLSSHSLPPYRIFDTRSSGWNPNRQVAGVSERGASSVVPVGASAISFTSALIGAAGTGSTYVAVWPGDQPWGGASSGLFNAGNIGETAGVVGLAPNGFLNFARGPAAANVILDMAFDADG